MKQFKLFFTHLRHAIFNSSKNLHNQGAIQTVSYDEHRLNIRTGDIMAMAKGNSGGGFGAKIFSAIVSGLTGYKIYHVATLIVTDGRLFSLEAMIPRVTLCLLSTRVPFYHIAIPDHLNRIMTDENFISLCYTYLGEDYSIKDVLQAYWETELDDKNGVICTELVNNLLCALVELDVKETLIPGQYVRKLQELDFRITFVVP